MNCPPTKKSRRNQHNITSDVKFCGIISETICLLVKSLQMLHAVNNIRISESPIINLETSLLSEILITLALSHTITGEILRT